MFNDKGFENMEKKLEEQTVETETVETENIDAKTDESEAICKKTVNADYGSYSYMNDFRNNMNNPINESAAKKMPVFKKVVISAACIALVAVLGLGINSGLNYFNLNYGSEESSSSNKSESEGETKIKVSTTSGSSTASTSSNGGVIITDVSDVVEDVMPSIVAITSTIKVNDYGYYDWFGNGGSYEQEGAGSGIIVGETDSELLIVTNNHVVADSTSLSVQFINDVSVEANIKGTDPDADLAIVAIPLESIDNDTLSAIKIATLGDSDKLAVGDGVIAIGNALGYGQSVTTGVVSALNREVQVDDNTLTLIQTDAAINGGNSGGALINANGEVIGINVAKYSSSSYSSSASIEGMGFAIPVSQAMDKINELMNKETRTKVDEDKRGYLGITGYDVSESESEIYGFPVGVFVTSVTDGSGADKAGIQKQDVIVAVDGIEISTMEELKEKLEYYAVNDKIELTIECLDGREYVKKDVTVTLGSADTLPDDNANRNVER